VSRGGVLLAVALTLAPSPAAAAGQTASQPDLVIVGRHGTGVTGNDVYNDTGVGQQRSVNVTGHWELFRQQEFRLRLQNDGAEDADFSVCIAPSSNAPIGFRIFGFGRDQSEIDPSACDPQLQLTRRIAAGRSVALSLVVDVDPDTPLGERETVLVVATHGAASDAVLIKVTNVSTPA
jgi:hypothetical protein